mmetsp:Transcript_36263/g.74499  ORF Transcript_36263/g.74499 Transcript_36263/m.74499 type:complete len:119 (+) Transcript_36263:656-1012(+)
MLRLRSADLLVPAIALLLRLGASMRISVLLLQLDARMQEYRSQHCRVATSLWRLRQIAPAGKAVVGRWAWQEQLASLAPRSRTWTALVGRCAWQEQSAWAQVTPTTLVGRLAWQEQLA